MAGIRPLGQFSIFNIINIVQGTSLCRFDDALLINSKMRNYMKLKGMRF